MPTTRVFHILQKFGTCVFHISQSIYTTTHVFNIS